jgi:general secretion pathway protein E
VFELLVANAAISQLIHERAPEAQLREAALAGGMQLMREDAERLVQAGITTRAEVARVTRD